MDIIRLGRPRRIRCKEDLLHTMSPYDPQKLFIRDLGKAGCRIEPYVFTNQKFLSLPHSISGNRPYEQERAFVDAPDESRP